MMIEHEIKVSHLRELLAQLKDDDMLYPNRVRNITIYREWKAIGYINLLAGHQEIIIFDNPLGEETHGTDTD